MPHIHLLLLDMSTFDIEHYSSGNENIHTKLFETSHPAGKQITTVNIFQLSLSTKMLSEVRFSWECQLIFLSIAILMVATFTFDLIEIFINWFFLNLQIHLHSIFHFSFLVGLWLLSIDIFLNRNSNGRNFIFDLIEIFINWFFIQSPNTPTCYFSLFLSSWIEIVINWYFSQSLSTHICNYI